MWGGEGGEGGGKEETGGDRREEEVVRRKENALEPEVRGKERGGSSMLLALQESLLLGIPKATLTLRPLVHS